MSGYGYLSAAIAKWFKKETQENFTIGKVEDTNDPEQMGRVRIRCAAWSDSASKKISDLPLAIPVSPLAGIVSYGKRGVEQSEIDGPVAYGMWNTPKIGSYVVVGCIDGDRSKRFYIGGIHPQFATHTMPHGRFLWSEDTGYGLPDGPLATNEQPIEPLYTNIEKQFTPSGDLYPLNTPSDPRYNLEYRSRGADMQVSALNHEQTQHPLDSPGNTISDYSTGEFITITQEDGSSRVIKGPGYSVDQLEPDDVYPNTGNVNYDSHVYSWVTPGMHAFTMDDRDENCRIRIRTTSGHQIIMDDTNERIYINTAGGETWIELDKVGNVDIFASKNISTHAGGDINFYADKTVRIQGKEGVHIQSGSEFRLHSSGEFHIKSDGLINVQSGTTIDFKVGSQLNIETTSDFNLKVGGSIFEQSSSAYNVTSGTGMFITSGSTMNVLSSGNILMTASNDIHLNGPPAASASLAGTADIAKESFYTSRVPMHEPWARVFMDSSSTDLDASNAHVLEFSYIDLLVGRGGRGETYARNPLWNR